MGLNKNMECCGNQNEPRKTQHRRANFPGQDSAVYKHLEDEAQSFGNKNIQIADGEDRHFARGAKEAKNIRGHQQCITPTTELSFHPN